VFQLQPNYEIARKAKRSQIWCRALSYMRWSYSHLHFVLVDVQREQNPYEIEERQAKGHSRTASMNVKIVFGLT
jgi:hypothetical protein